MKLWTKKVIIALTAAGLSVGLPTVPAMAQDADQSGQLADYRINPGDVLEIYVWGEERLQRNVNVLPDGTIAFPLIGQLNVRGLLPSELEERIREGLSDQYRGEVPQVTISVSPVGMQFSVIGRVNSPGNFQPGRYVNALEALSLAGGPNEFADVNNIVIIRKFGDELRPIRVRMGGLLKGSVSRSDVSNSNLVRIESGDTVIVP
ncbi:sugar transporter [Altererythrobacter aurantiacus]|uniref:Sugar transporter n=1 Tax=Parapontixanthobacter aurantiacus TaxID=1463599 RepID=A0A844ZN13_9SPHN|nr:polysaccharide biosynthesis/export family protein [Parapontixanthobacter aurantiacus]MXO87039.1 sugar transporter [Parapontixanthobacter aurantiacus]